MNELLEKHQDQFDEFFPLMLFMGTDKEEIKAKIEECLKNDEPYEAPEISEDELIWQIKQNGFPCMRGDLIDGGILAKFDAFSPHTLE